MTSRQMVRDQLDVNITIPMVMTSLKLAADQKGILSKVIYDDVIDDVTNALLSSKKFQLILNEV